MERNRLEALILSKLKEFVDENSIDVEDEITIDSRLIGRQSFLDSIGLVTFIVEVEQFLAEDLDLEIELASDKAMSRSTSPFISVKTLSNFILEEIDGS